MIILRRVVAVLLVVVFAALLVSEAVARTVDGSFLSPAFLKEQLVRNEVYTFALQEAVPQELHANSTSLQGLPLTTAELTELVQASISESYLQEQVEVAIDSVVPYVAGRTDDVALTIPIRDRKRAFEMALATILIRKYDALPPCPKVADFRIPNGFPNCRVGDSSGDLLPVLVAEYNALPACTSPAQLQFNPFPSCNLSRATPEIERELGARYAALPICIRLEDIMTGDTFPECQLGQVTPERLLGLLSLSDELDKVVPDQLTVTTADITENAPQIDDVRGGLRTMRTFLWFGLLLLAAVAAAVAFLGGRSWRGRLAWAASGLVVGGLLLIVLAAAGRQGSASAINELAAQGTGFSTQIEDKVFQVIQGSVNAVVGTVQLWGILLLVAGVLGVLLPLVVFRSKQQPQRLPKPPKALARR